MYISLGIGMFIVGILNYGKVIYDVLMHSMDDDDDNDFDGEKVVEKFMMNASVDHMQFLAGLIDQSKWLFGLGTICIMIGLFL